MSHGHTHHGQQVLHHGLSHLNDTMQRMESTFSLTFSIYGDGERVMEMKHVTLSARGSHISIAMLNTGSHYLITMNFLSNRSLYVENKCSEHHISQDSANNALQCEVNIAKTMYVCVLY